MAICIFTIKTTIGVFMKFYNEVRLDNKGKPDDIVLGKGDMHLENITEFMVKIFNFSYGSMIGNYKERKIGRVEGKENNGIGVSTCFITDMNEPYETALLDNNGAHPVERYMTKKEAIQGHRKWVKKAQSLTKVIRLGSEDGLVEDKEITLERIQS